MEVSNEQLRALVREEVDRREAEVQSRCMHLEGSIIPGGNINTVQCNSCMKVLNSEDFDAPGPGQPSTPFMESHYTRGN
ncbi:hypothetical protein LCGC14_1273970 [marine sediment metagenome]|uniref:Uncharacterized protein n=1 Tax=marine sediment metagenome TaxID=412755 RepID=A0A0F9LIG4_9ZZZZ